MGTKKKKKKKVRKFKPTHAWCIAYIDAERIQHAEKQLRKSSLYYDVEHYIPTVQILKKQFKGKDHFEDVPLLFNYGFFKIPIEKAANPEFLNKLRQDISCISGWVKNATRLAKNGTNIAMASDEEIVQLIKYSKSHSIHTSKDIRDLAVGKLIHLIGYPWEGMPAEVMAIDLEKRKVTVGLIIEDELGKPVTVSFDNIFYTIYHGGHDENDSKEKVFDHPLRTGADNSNKEYE